MNFIKKQKTNNQQTLINNQQIQINNQKATILAKVSALQTSK